jgi:hypothetical protein
MVSASPLAVWRTPLRFVVCLPEPCNFNTKAVSISLMVSSWKLTRCKFTQNFDLFLVQIHTHICYSIFNDYHTLHHWHGCGHHHNWEFPVPMESCSLSSMRRSTMELVFCHLPPFFMTTSLSICNLFCNDSTTVFFLVWPAYLRRPENGLVGLISTSARWQAYLAEWEAWYGPIAGT